MNSAELRAETLRTEQSMEYKFHADLNMLRATINEELIRRDVMNRGRARAIFHHQQSHATESPTHVETLVYVKPAHDANEGDYYKPNIRIIVNETSLQDPGDVWIVKDFIADEYDQVQYMADLFDDDDPDFPNAETIKPADHDVTPWLPLFYATENGIVLTSNYCAFTPSIGVNVRGESQSPKFMFPFGESENLPDKAQSLESGRELVLPLADAKLVYVEPVD